MHCAAIYVRISDDREGAGLGVKRQEGDCRDLAERLDWSIADVYPDNDVSAYSGRTRPEYARMLADVRAGHVSAIIAWHPDRLHRSPRELEDFIDLIEQRRVAVQTVRAGEYDLSTPSGRAVARTLGAWARYESEHKAERITAKHAELAAAGALTGGGHRPYGLERIYDRDERPRRVVDLRLVPEEAAIIREAARRVLAGEALAAVCRDLNARGFPTSTGARWSTATLGRLLASARIAGAREHRPRARAETRRVWIGEITARGVYPAIISEEDSARLRALLADPRRRRSPGPAGRNLLTRVLVCHRCPEVFLNSRGGASRGRRAYFCDGQPGRRGCGLTEIDGIGADATVVAWVADALSDATFRQAITRRDGPDDAAALASIGDAERELEQLAADMGGGLISRREWLAARKPVETRLGEARAALASADVVRTLDGVPTDADGIRAYLLDSDIETTRRRAVVLAAVERVTVSPAVKGRGRFDAGRLTPTWRV